ncbi:MAG: hypothetical protein LQ340_007755 [Diploschistes diacapsis]|nr:MAG: hypothetical protein LQ340_007755 [Diploschistes diacapsis]
MSSNKGFKGASSTKSTDGMSISSSAAGNISLSMQESIRRAQNLLRQQAKDKDKDNIHDVKSGVQAAARERYEKAQRKMLDERARQEAIAQLEKELAPRVEKKLKKSLRQDVESQLRADITEALHDELEPQIREELTSWWKQELEVTVQQQLRQELRDEVIDQLREDLRAEVCEQLIEEMRPAMAEEIQSELLLKAMETGDLGAPEPVEQPQGNLDIMADCNGLIDPALHEAVPVAPNTSQGQPRMSGQKRRLSDVFDEEGGTARKRARSVEEEAGSVKTANNTPRETINPDNAPPCESVVKFKSLYASTATNDLDSFKTEPDPDRNTYPIKIEREESATSAVEERLTDEDTASSDLSTREEVMDSSYVKVEVRVPHNHRGGSDGVYFKQEFTDENNDEAYGEDYDEEGYDEEGEYEEEGDYDEVAETYRGKIYGAAEYEEEPGQTQDDPIMLDDD